MAQWALTVPSTTLPPLKPSTILFSRSFFAGGIAVNITVAISKCGVPDCAPLILFKYYKGLQIKVELVDRTVDLQPIPAVLLF